MVEERVPPTPVKEREEAVVELTWRFLRGHGPASAAHLVRWSTLTKREVLGAVAELGDRLERLDVEGEPHWYAAADPAPGDPGGALLLPVFDEAYLTYPGSNFPRVPDHPWGERSHSFAEAGGGVVVHDRRDAGWWKRTESGATTRVTLGLADSLGPSARGEIEAQAAVLAAFTGRELDLQLVTDGSSARRPAPRPAAPR